MEFPTTADGLEDLQERLGRARPAPYRLPSHPLAVAAVYVCFGRGGRNPGAAGDHGWAAAVVLDRGRVLDSVTLGGVAGAPYRAGLLALREGPLLASAVEALDTRFDVLMVNATGRDHPRRAGLALHLGAVFGVPTVGVTHRPLLAHGPWPSQPDRGARTPLRIDDEVVGFWLRTRTASRPLAVHAAWRTDPDTATELTLAIESTARTPEPLRCARQRARSARAAMNLEWASAG